LIFLHDGALTFAQVSLGASPVAKLTANEATALDFCRRWLAGDPQFLLHTSGSTGEPKPVHLLRSQMEASARATAAAVGLQPDMHSLCCLPTRYIAGAMMLVRGLVIPLVTALAEPAANPLLTLDPASRFDFAAFTPLQMQAILDGPVARQTQLAGATAILLGGGPLSPALELRLRGFPAPLYHTYGMTETVSHVALRRINGDRPAERFAPLPGVQLRQDDRGCLTITAPMTNGQAVVTNDRVELDGDGTFLWLGRADFVINSGGVKVQGERVEQAVGWVAAEQPVLLSPSRRFFVTGAPDPRLGETVTLVLEGAPLQREEEATLLALLRERLDRFAVPRAIHYVARFAETPTGKVDRRRTMG
jgi:O-succinylbenzoic acid--CoA ligase